MSKYTKDLEEMFKTILKADSVRSDDNFFKIGGNSLLGVTLVNEINDKYDVDIDISEIFEVNSIEKLSEYLDENGGEEAEEMEL